MRKAEKTAETHESGETRNRKATAPLDAVTLTTAVADRNHFFIQKARPRGKLSGALLSVDALRGRTHWTNVRRPPRSTPSCADMKNSGFLGGKFVPRASASPCPRLSPARFPGPAATIGQRHTGDCSCKIFSGYQRQVSNGSGTP
jgi:hypothetical protein